MNEQPSFERFDYLLRANKHIERKLVFDVLRRAELHVGLDQHRYFGLGSLWYGDFRPAHKLLGINDLISVELEEHAERALFNRPYACIDVRAGTCSEILHAFGEENWQRPYIAWFDYDGRLDKTVVDDLSFFTLNCAPNSVVLATVNADRRSYRERNPDPKNRAHTSIGGVEHFLGTGSTAPRFEPAKTDAGTFRDIDTAGFPEFLADAMLAFLAHGVSTSGRQHEDAPLEFVPLVNLAHRDGADMVTIGGAISTAQAVPGWRTSAGVTGQLPHIRLDLVPITIKEKLTLDACSPHLPEGYVDRARAAGLQLSADQIGKYQRFYRHFPVFAESVL